MRRPGRVELRLRDEEGIALAVAMIVLMVITMLVAAAVGVATQTNGSTRSDANKKTALEAAEAGLQVALYRLNMLRPDDQHCVGDQVALPDGTGTCQSSSNTLGNGSSYSYAMTPTMGSSATCVGLNVQSSSSISQRCITSTGAANGISARSQIRVAAFAAQPLFPYGGLTGLKSVTLTGGATVTGTAASNGTVTASGIANAQGIVLGPGGTFTHSGNVSYGQVSNISSPIVLSPVDPGTSNQSSLSACPARQTAGYPACNDNYRIQNGLATPLQTPYDPSASISYNAATRTLTMIGNASLTLGGGIYNFCELDTSGNSTITIASGAVKTEVFIDSPDDPNSGCPASSGNLNMNGNTSWVNPSADPTALQIYEYGRNNGSSSITLSGQAAFYGVLYAPQSSIRLSGNSAVYGAIAGSSVTMSGNGFNWDSRAGSLQAHTTGIDYRTAWAQCTPAPTVASSPGSGCG